MHGLVTRKCTHLRYFHTTAQIFSVRYFSDSPNRLQHEQTVQLQQVSYTSRICSIFISTPFCSVGDDGILRLWDRRVSEPLQTHVAHDNWYFHKHDLFTALHFVWFFLTFSCSMTRCFGLAINPFHDQLTVPIPPKSPNMLIFRSTCIQQ